MKRILSLVLTFAMVFTTFGPSVYATGEGIAEIIGDDTAVLEQVDENPDENIDGITPFEEVEETPDEGGTTPPNPDGSEPVVFGEDTTTVYTPVYLTGGDTDRNDMDYQEVTVFNTEPNSVVGIAFRDSDNNYVDIYGVDWLNSDEISDISYDKFGGTLTDGTAVGFYRIEFGENTPADQYELEFAVQGQTVYANVNVMATQGGDDAEDYDSVYLMYTLNDSGTFVKADGPIAVSAGDEVKLRAEGVKDGVAQIIPIEKVTPKAYNDSTGEFEPCDPFDGFAISREENYYNFVIGAAAAATNGVDDSWYTYGFDIGATELDLDFKVAPRDPSVDNGVWYKREGDTEYQLFDGRAVEVAEDETIYFYVKSFDEIVQTFNYEEESNGKPASAVTVEFGTAATNFVNTIKFNGTPQPGEVYGYNFYAAGTRWGFAIILADDDSYVCFEDDIIRLPESGKKAYNTEFHLRGSEYIGFKMGYIDEDTDEFVPFAFQYGYGLYKNEKDHITAVEFNVGEIAEAYPDIYEKGYFTAALYVEDTGSSILSSCTPVWFAHYDNGEGDGGEGSDSYVRFEDDIIRLPDGGKVTYNTTFRLSGTEYIGFKIGYVDEDTNEFIPFPSQSGYTVNLNRMNHIESVEFDAGELMNAYPVSYETGYFTAALYVEDEGSSILSSCTPVWFAHYNREGDFTQDYTGNVYWRKYGETEWKLASSGVDFLPFDVIEVELFDVLEIKFTDSNGNVNNGECRWYDREDGQLVLGLYNQTEGSYYAISNTSSGLLENNGKSTIVISVNGAKYVLNYTITYPDLEPQDGFDGYAMAVIGDHDNPEYVSFDDFVATAENYQEFGIQFYDENGEPISSERVKPVLYGSFDGFDINLRSDYDWEEAQWINYEYQVKFNEDAQSGTFSVDFLIDGTDLATVTFNAEGRNQGGGQGGNPGGGEEIMFWFSHTGEDGDWAYMHTGNSPWCDIDMPFYVKITDADGNLIENDRIQSVYIDGDAYTGDGMCTWGGMADDKEAVWLIGVDRYEYDICLARLGGNEYDHRHHITFNVDGCEYSREFIVGHDPMFSWINWDWNFYANGCFSIKGSGKTEMGINMYKTRTGWTADIQIGKADDDGFKPARVQKGIEVTETYAPGVPKTVVFDGDVITSTYDDLIRANGGYLHVNILFYDENGTYCGNTGCDVEIERAYAGTVLTSKDGENFVTYAGSEQNPLTVKAGETFLIQFTDSNGNILESGSGAPLPVQLIDQHEYNEMGISVWQNPSMLTAMIYSDVRGLHQLKFEVTEGDERYVTDVWLKVEAPAAMAKAPSNWFEGQLTIGGRSVENGSTVYMTEDYMFIGAVDSGFNEYGDWYCNEIPSSDIKLSYIDKDIFKYTKSVGNNTFSAYRIESDNFRPGDETVIRLVVGGKRAEITVIRDMDAEYINDGVRAFTGSIYVIDQEGNRYLYYSYLDENGDVRENPYNYSEEDVLEISANNFFELEFYDFEGNVMTGPREVLEIHPEYNDIFEENHVNMTWDGEHFRIFTTDIPAGHIGTVLNQRYIQGNAWVELSLDITKEEIEVPENAELFSGKVYSGSKAYSFANQDLIHLKRDGSVNILFKEIINGAEVAVDNRNVKLATNYYSGMLYMDKDEDGVSVNLNGLGSGESGIFVLDFIVNGELCPVYVAYDLYSEWGDGSLHGIWEYGKEKDEDGNYIVKGIRYHYFVEDGSLEFYVEVPSEGDGYVISKAFSDATFKNVKTKIKRVQIPNGIKGIENKALRAFTNMEFFSTMDRHWTDGRLAPMTLADGEFAGLAKLKYVTLRETNIGDEAFKGCKALVLVEINDLVEKWHAEDPENTENIPCYVGSNAFNGCTALSNVYMEGNLEFGSTPFKGCTKLTSFGNGEFGEYSIMYGGAFRIENRTDGYDSWEEHVQFIPANMLSGSSVKKAYIYDIDVVETGAFSGCTALTEVEFNDRIRTIEDSAFSGCNNIKTVKYSKDFARWYRDVYVGEDNGSLNRLVINSDYIYVLEEGYISEDGESVKYAVFSDRTMYIEGNGAMMDFDMMPILDSEWEDEDGNIHQEFRYEVDSPMYKWRHFVDSIYIMPGVTHIGDYAFYEFGRAGGVTFAQTGTSEATIGEKAFAEMHSLRVFNMPVTVNTVADNVFENSGSNPCDWQIRTANAEPLRHLEDSNPWLSVTEMNYELDLWSNTINLEDIKVMFKGEGEDFEDEITLVPGLPVTVRAYNTYAWDEIRIPQYIEIEGVKIATESTGTDANGEYIETSFIAGTHNDYNTYINMNVSYQLENYVASGKAGKNVTWRYDNNVLVLSGTGATYDYIDSYTNTGAPWQGLYINTLIVEEGITAIGDGNFAWMDINKLVLPKTLKSIGDYNFNGINTEELVFPENLTSLGTDSFNEASVNRIVFNSKLKTIGRESFQNMYSYTFGQVVGEGEEAQVQRNFIDITIPASVTSIGEGAFTNGGYEREYWNDYGELIGNFTSTLRSITVEPANPYYKVENGALMTKDGKMFIALPAEAKVHYGQYIPVEDEMHYTEFDGIYTVPYGVETLGHRALSGHQTITGVNLPESLKEIGVRAFANVPGLTHIVLPDSLTYIDSAAFETCCNLKAVHIGKNLEYMGYGVFECCESLEKIDTDPANKYMNFDGGFIVNGETLNGVLSNVSGDIVIPSKIKAINDYSLTYNFNITGIQIPSSVTYIGDYAFYGSEPLRKIIIPSSVSYIGAGALSTLGSEPVEVYFTGTEAQWEKLMGKADIFEGQAYTLEYWKPEIRLEVSTNEDEYAEVNGEYTAESEEYVLYAEHPYKWYWVSAYSESVNPIFGDSTVEETAINAYSTDRNVVAVDKFNGGYHVAVVGGGEADIVFESAIDNSVSYTKTIKVTQMSTSPELSAKGTENAEGRIIVVPTTKAQTIAATTAWDGAKWPAGTYSYSIQVISGNGIFEGYEGYAEEGYGMEWKDGVPMPTVDAAGKITIPAYTSKQLAQFEEYSNLTYGEDPIKFNLVLTLEDAEKGEGPFSTELPFTIYPQKVKGVDVTVSMPVDEYGMYEQLLDGNQAGKTIIMDAYAGDTVRYIYADATNSDMAYNAFTYTTSASDCFEIVPGRDGNSAMVKLINGTSGSVKVTIKSVDGAKSATVTFKTGTAVETLKVASNAAFLGKAEIGGEFIDAYVITSGKSAKHTATVTPSNATTKAVKWYVDVEPPMGYDYDDISGLITINSKGEVKVAKQVPEGTTFFVTAETTDGTGKYDSIAYIVAKSASAVYVGETPYFDDVEFDENGLPKYKSHTITVGADEYEDGFAAGTLYAVPYGIVKNENGEVENVDENLVAPLVNWSVKKAAKNDISKYVTIIPKSFDAFMGIATVDFRVDGPRNGSFIICATAADGSGKKMEYTVNVATEQYAIDAVAPKGVGVYDDTWVLKASSTGVTLKPTVVWNNGQSKPSDTRYEIIFGANIIPTNYKFKNSDAGEYTYQIRSAADNTLYKEINLKVVPSSDVHLGSLDLVLPDTITYDPFADEYIVAEGAKVELIQMLNGLATTKTTAEKEWQIDGVEITGITSKTKPISTSSSKHYLTVPAGMAGSTMSVTCTYGNGVDTISDTLNIRVVEKAQDIRFVKDGVQIDAMKNYLKPDLGTVVFDVYTEGQSNTCQDFTVKSSNEKLLDIEKVNGTTFEVTPLGVGKVNVTITANDGSGASKVYKNIQVGKVASPVTSITTEAKSIYVDTDMPVAMTFALNATGAPATMSDFEDMLWTSSDEDIVGVWWTDADNDVLTKTTVSKGKTTNYYASEGLLTLTPGIKTGKATVTGKALDGSNKTVKVTVTVAAGSDTEDLNINVPAGTALEDHGKAVLAWGKSIKLNPTFNKGAKNTTVKYTVEAVEPIFEYNEFGQEIITGYVVKDEATSGITVSGSTIKAAAAGKSVPTPYSGWIRVKATLDHGLYVNGIVDDPLRLVDTEYIYVVKPVSKISVAQLALSKGNYTLKEVTSIKAKAGETVALTASPYVFAVNYKENGTNTIDSETYGSVAWTSSNPAIARVNDMGEVVIADNAKNKSTVTIKAVSKDGTKVAKSIKITIAN